MTMESLNLSLLPVFVSLSIIGITIVAWQLFLSLLWRPLTVQRILEKQGVKSLPFKFVTGSLKEMKRLNEEGKRKPMTDLSHDIIFRVLPSYHQWSKQYGEMFLLWFGHQPRLVVTDADMIRDILSNKFGFFTKVNPRSLKAILGKGLVFVADENWVKHRRVVNPAFHVDKLKGMTKRMAACTLAMLEDWKDKNKEVDVHGELKELTANIIAHTAFGSCYAEGKEVFKAQEVLSRLFSATTTDIHFPGFE